MYLYNHSGAQEGTHGSIFSEYTAITLLLPQKTAGNRKQRVKVWLKAKERPCKITKLVKSNEAIYIASGEETITHDTVRHCARQIKQ